MSHHERLMRLYALRVQIDAEIGEVEALIDAELARIRRLRIATQGRRKAKATCGTDGGYYRHRRTLKEPACEPCRTAHRLAERDRVAKKRMAA